MPMASQKVMIKSFCSNMCAYTAKDSKNLGTAACFA